MNSKTVIRRIMIGLFFVIVFGIGWRNFILPWQVGLKEEVESFSDFTQGVHEIYPDELKEKNGFININGGFTRLIGKSVCNNIARLENGYLYGTVKKEDVMPYADRLNGFADFCEENNIEIVFVSTATKLDANKELLPFGFQSFGNENADEMIATLSKQINVLDLRPTLSATPELVEENFFKTDHHWNFHGAFKGAQLINDFIQEILNVKQSDNLLMGNKWESHHLESWFLGSSGKRTGIFFGGVDDIIYYTPRFETYISQMVFKHLRFRQGDFIEANMETRYFTEKNYFKDNPYAMYIGGDYPLVTQRNSNAPIKKRLLILKDSYGLPVQAFLSTVYQEIDVIDPRYFNECTLRQYVANTDPDLVLLITSGTNMGGFFREEFYAETMSQPKEAGNELTIEKLEIPIADTKYNLKEVRAKLKPKETYRISFDKVEAIDGDIKAVQVLLYDKTNSTPISSWFFDIYYHQQTEKEYSWTFTVPEEPSDYVVIIYAGLRGYTEGCGMNVYNITLQGELDE